MRNILNCLDRKLEVKRQEKDAKYLEKKYEKIRGEKNRKKTRTSKTAQTTPVGLEARNLR